MIRSIVFMAKFVVVVVVILFFLKLTQIHILVCQDYVCRVGCCCCTESFRLERIEVSVSDVTTKIAEMTELRVVKILGEPCSGSECVTDLDQQMQMTVF